MKFKAVIISIISSLSLCLTTNVATHAENEHILSTNDYYSKISNVLLSEFGVSRDSLNDTQQILDSYTSELPVLIWTTKDINHEEVNRLSLSTLSQDGNYDSTEIVQFLNYDSDTDLAMKEVQDFIKTERSISREMYSRLNEKFVSQHLPDKNIIYQSRYSPVVIASLTLSDVISLSLSDDTMEFDYFGSEDLVSDPLNNSIVACNAKITRDTYGYSGYGVNIGQLEYHYPDDSNPQLPTLGVRFHRLPLNSSSYPSNFHGTAVADIMVGKQYGSYSHGVAPLATLYSTSCYNYNDNDLAAIEDLLDSNVNVINLSHYFGNQDPNLTNEYNAYAKWLDHIAIDHYVTVVISAGNTGSSGVFNSAMSYNAITVGNVNDMNTPTVTDDILDTSSSYSTATGVAYKPDLCAPGVGIVCSATPTGGIGTSFSAPHVTGAVALLFEAKPSFMLKPEVVKSLFTAAVNPNSIKRYVPSEYYYRQYGAGLLDTYQAITSARKGKYWISNLTPSVTSRTNSNKLSVSSSNSKVRVSLSFLKNNYIYGSSHTMTGTVYHTSLPNLNLRIYAPNGMMVAQSTSLHNNVEICEFTANPVGNYTIEVISPNSLSETVNYGVSWMIW